MIKINYEPNFLKLTVKGHAGAEKKGEDVICAGVSAIVGTLAAAVENMFNGGAIKEGYKLRLKDGEACISVRAKEGYKATVRLNFDNIILGLRLIAEKYPEHVSFEMKN